METMIKTGDLLVFVFELGPAYELLPHAIYSLRAKRYLTREDWPPFCLLRSS